jgi:hypothetical protein
VDASEVPYEDGGPVVCRACHDLLRREQPLDTRSETDLLIDELLAGLEGDRP